MNELLTEKRFEPYIISEIGVNYFDIADEEDMTPLKAAKKMIDEAAKAGTDAVKFQSYSAEKLASKKSPAYWDTDEESTESQHELFQKYDSFGRREFNELSKYTDKHGIDFLSTPFDKDSVDYISKLAPAIKVASGDITDIPLLKYIAEKGNPVILSTGASTLGEVATAVENMRQVDEELDISLLHCVLSYPTDPENANLSMIEHIDDAFPKCRVGYSDHVAPDERMITLVNAWRHGASIIEKHFTLDKSLPGNDHYHAMNPSDLSKLSSNLKIIKETSGSKDVKQPLQVEQNSRKYARRSLVANEAIEKGEAIDGQQVSIKRPGTGIQPKMLEKIIGREARKKIEEDDILTWDHI